MIDAREFVRDGNAVWVSGDLLPFTSTNFESAMHRFVCAGHDKLVIDFRNSRTIHQKQIDAAHRLARTALRGRVRVTFVAASDGSRTLQRSGLNSLMTLLTVGEGWQRDEAAINSESRQLGAAD